MNAAFHSKFTLIFFNIFLFSLEEIIFFQMKKQIENIRHSLDSFSSATHSRCIKASINRRNKGEHLAKNLDDIIAIVQNQNEKSLKILNSLIKKNVKRENHKEK